MTHLDKPKIRNVTAQRTTYQGEPVFLLQDRLKLTEAAIVLPQVLGPLVMLCDGNNTLPEIKAALEVRYGLRLPQETLEGMLAQFDQALLLEGGTFEHFKQQAIAEYRAAPFRQPTLAGLSYPADPEALRRMLQDYLDEVREVPAVSPDSRGIISPHIDYQRGGPVYAQLWASAAEAVRQAELVIIFGTDHNGGNLGTINLTCQNYSSPLGVMPTDQDLVARLAAALGPQTVFADELLHRDEWSIELVLVWLQYMRDGKPCPVLPILSGSFLHFMMGQAKLEEETNFSILLDLLREEMTKRRTLVVASGDLAHLGPAFDGPPLDAAAQAQMKVDDKVLIDTLAQGSASAFFELMQAGQYERNVCGLSPFYFTLSALSHTQGQTIAYDRCPADNRNTSFVSICGMVLE
ncbi:MAG: AmmeMemoRadiSam system protein B [Anaerolineales bacterium]|nr:AmmeMemoRadiSam system protein B [Anaerolineales bacterium]